MAGRRDGDQLGDRVDAVAAAGGEDGREAASPRTPRRGGGRRATCAGWPVSFIRRVIALATTSRGARSASSCSPCMKRWPSKSTRNAPSPRTASEISGCWPRESGPSYITVGWNCTNSRSRSTRSGRAAPPPCRRRWRRPGWWSGEKTWPRPPLASTTARQCTAPTPSRWPSPITCSVSAGDAAVVGEQQVDGERVLDDLDLGRALDGGDQGPLDLGAGRVAAGVRDPVAVVAALAGQRQLAVGVVVELGAERDQLADRVGSLGDQRPHGVAVARAGARDQGVALVLLGGVARAERGGDAALRPLGRAGVEHVLGDDEDRCSRGAAAWIRSAAVSPAMPEPTTTTSARLVQPGRAREAAGTGRCGHRAG